MGKLTEREPVAGSVRDETTGTGYPRERAYCASNRRAELCQGTASHGTRVREAAKTSSRDLLVENTLIAALLPRPVYLTLLRSCATQWDSDQIALSIQGLVATGMRDAEVLELVLELTPRVAPHLTDTRLQILSLFADTLYQPAMPLLGEALRDSNAQIRSRAQEALQQFRQQREAMEEFGTWMQAARQQASTTAQLIELLQSQDRAVVLGAVRALGTIKARNALPELVKLLARNDAELTSAVEAAIAAM